MTPGLGNRCSRDVTDDGDSTYEAPDNRLVAQLAAFIADAPDLKKVVEAWPALPGPIRAAIIALVGTAGK